MLGRTTGFSRTPAGAAILAGLAIALAVAGQASLDAQPAYWLDAGLLFGLAIGLWWLVVRDEPAEGEGPVSALPGPVLDRARQRALLGGLGCILLTASIAPALARTGAAPLAGIAARVAVLRYPFGWANNINTFTLPGAVLWLLGCALVLWAVAEPISQRWTKAIWRDDRLELRLERSTLALLAILLLAAVLRFADLAALPQEMTSDHVEKLLDISDVLAGRRPVYLPRNAGREPLEFYWIAVLIRLGLPFGFMAMKVGMGLVSLATIPVVYWVGRRGWGTEVGLWAALALSLSPWHLQITRAGLRIGLAPLFVALCLGCLLTAMDTGRRNAWLALGVSLGAGMYGYSAFRSMAFLVPIAVLTKIGWDAWRLGHRRRLPAAAEPSASPTGQSRAGAEQNPAAAEPLPAAEQGPPRAGSFPGAEPGPTSAEQGPALPARRVAWPDGLSPLAIHLGLSFLAAVLVAVPLIRFALDHPETFWGRTMTRVTGAEVPLQHPPLVQFALNWRQALLMFNATSDSAWLQSPPGRPALETVTGALFVLGVVATLSAIRRGRWRELLLLLAVPVLLLSSTLALAFPNEVPHLARASGALPAVMIILALPLRIALSLWRRALGAYGTTAALMGFALLFAWSGHNARTRYFVEYRRAYNQATHPTSEGAAVAQGFLAMGGDLDHVYLVGWAHGWDYRALGLQMGDPDWNGLLWGAAADGSDAVTVAAGHVSDPQAKLYFVGGEWAQANLAYLRQLFPTALVSQHHSVLTGKDFWTVYVPGKESEADDG